MSSQISFNAVTTATDGTTLTEPVSYNALIDTVNPPVKSYAVPAANVTAAVAGVITVTFAQLGFTPTDDVTYYVDVTATDADGTSAPSSVVSFVNKAVPAAPTGLKIS
jgi:hypothetical protein